MSYAPPGESAYDLYVERVGLDSTILTGVFYGMLFLLYVAAFRRLWIHRKKNETRTWLFIGYINLMFILGTLYFISITWNTQAAYVDYRNYPGGPLGFGGIANAFPLIYLGNVVFSLADWFADGLLLWRCTIIWKGSRLQPLIILPTLAYLCNIALSIVLLNQSNQPTDLESSFDASTPYFVISLVVTISISTLIVLRIVLQRNWILRTTGELESHATRYVSIAAMIIESAALYSVFSLAFLVTFVIGNPLTTLFLPLLAQAQIISPLLIIYRVAKGRSWGPESSSTNIFSTEIHFTNAPVTLPASEANETGSDASTENVRNIPQMARFTEPMHRW